MSSLLEASFSTTTHGALWLSLSASPGLTAPRLASLYSDLLAGVAVGGATAADLATFESIGRDVNRTFSGTAPVGSIERLRRVLTAIAVYDRSIGYVQGLNFLAAFAILHVEREDEAFILVVRLLNGPRYGMAVLFRERLRGVRAMARVLDTLIARYAPGADKALTRAGAGAIFFFEWHFSLFTLVLPASLAADVWDVIFAEGFAPAAHRAVVVLVRGLEPHFALAPGAHETLALLKAYARARATAGDGLGGNEVVTGVNEGDGDAALGRAIAAPVDLIARMSAETGITLQSVSLLTAEADSFIDSEDNVVKRTEPPPPSPRTASDPVTDAALAVATAAGLALLGFGATLALRAARGSKR